MACATLKRSLEFDPVHSHGRPNKRRRCGVPMCVSPSSSSPSSPPNSHKHSLFADPNTKLTSGKCRLEISLLQNKSEKKVKIRLEEDPTAIFIPSVSHIFSPLALTHDEGFTLVCVCL